MLIGWWRSKSQDIVEGFCWIQCRHDEEWSGTEVGDHSSFHRKEQREIRGEEVHSGIEVGAEDMIFAHCRPDTSIVTVDMIFAHYDNNTSCFTLHIITRLPIISMGSLLRMAAATKYPLNPHFIDGFSYALITAIRECHRLGFLHRNISPDCILLMIDSNERFMPQIDMF